MSTSVPVAILYTRGFPSQNALTTFRAELELFSRRVNSGRGVRSVKHITHRVLWDTSGDIADVTGIIATITIVVISAMLIHNAAFISSHDHAIIIRSKGPNEGIHVVLYPLRQVAPDDYGTGAMAATKSKWGSLS